MKKIAAALLGLFLTVGPASAQTSPNFTYKFVPSTEQWNSYFAGKQDYLGAPPLLTTGGTMVGPLVTAASTTGHAGFTITPGVAPTSPNNGDMWITSVGVFARVNGVTVDLINGACPTCAVTNATNTFTAAQIINLNTAPSDVAQTGTMLQLSQADTVNGNIEIDTYAGRAALVSLRSNGSLISPTTLIADNEIVAIAARGYDGTSRSSISAAAIRMFSAGTWSNTSHPSYIDLQTTASGSTTALTRMRIENDGSVTLNGATSIGPAGTISSVTNLNNETRWSFSNNSTGTGAFTFFSAVNSTSLAAFGIGGTGYTATAGLQNRAVVLSGATASGVTIYASSTNPIDFYNNGSRSGGFLSTGEFQTATIFGGSAAGSSLTLQGTNNGSPSGDSVVIKGASVTVRPNASGAVTLNVGVSGTAGGSINIAGSVSGAQIWKPASAASGTITWPAGTVDFSATGGASQVVKQTSAGGIFTVARLTCGDLSDATSGCTSTAGITALTGDGSAAGPGSAALTLTSVVTAGSAGSSTATPVLTWDVKGRITAASSATVTPAVGSITGFGTGVSTALTTNVGSAGAFVTLNGAGGTPSSIVLTNATGTAASLTAGNATNTAITDDTSTNAAVFPTWVTANTGNLPQKVSSTIFTMNPSLGTFGFGTTPAAGSVFRVTNAAASLSGVNQFAMNFTPTCSVGATSFCGGYYVDVFSAAGSYTITGMAGVYIDAAVKGAGSTVTTAYGLFVADQTTGATNYGVYSSGATNKNFFGGDTTMNAQTFVPNVASDTALTDNTLCVQTGGTGKVLKGTGTLGICLGTSGAQFKTSFAPMVGGLDEILRLHLQNYRYRAGFGDDGARVQYGLTAQDVEQALPDLVRYDASGIAINYDSGALLFIGLRAIQQLKSDNDNLRSELALKIRRK